MNRSQRAVSAGRDFEVVTVSFDPRDTAKNAADNKKSYLSRYRRAGVAEGWHFLTDYQGNAKRLAEQVGFNYRWDPKQETWAHAAAIMVLTPDGRVSRYLYGLQYRARDMRLALSEASEGKLGSFSDKVLLYCFHYDPLARSYVPFARNIMRAGGAMTVLVLGSILSLLWRRERRRNHHAPLPNGVASAK